MWAGFVGEIAACTVVKSGFSFLGVISNIQHGDEPSFVPSEVGGRVNESQSLKDPLSSAKDQLSRKQPYI